MFQRSRNLAVRKMFSKSILKRRNTDIDNFLHLRSPNDRNLISIYLIYNKSDGYPNVISVSVLVRLWGSAGLLCKFPY